LALAGHIAGCKAVSGCYLSIAYNVNGSVYMLRAAIYSASNFNFIFVTKYHTLLHMLWTSAPLSPCLHWAIPSLPPSVWTSFMDDPMAVKQVRHHW